MGGWYRKPVKESGRHEGLKIRIGGFTGKVTSTSGRRAAKPAWWRDLPGPGKETIDAAGGWGLRRSKAWFHKVAPFYHFPGWWEGGPQLDFYINAKAFNGLSAEYKAMIEAPQHRTRTEMQAMQRPGWRPRKQLVAAKTQLVQFGLCWMPPSRRPWTFTRNSTRRTQPGARCTPITPSSEPTRTCGSASPDHRPPHAGRQALSHERRAPAGGGLDCLAHRHPDVCPRMWIRSV